MKLASFVLATAALLSSTPSMADGGCTWMIESKDGLHYGIPATKMDYKVVPEVTESKCTISNLKRAVGSLSIKCGNKKEEVVFITREVVMGPKQGSKSTFTVMCMYPDASYGENKVSPYYHVSN